MAAMCPPGSPSHAHVGWETAVVAGAEYEAAPLRSAQGAATRPCRRPCRALSRAASAARRSGPRRIDLACAWLDGIGGVVHDTESRVCDASDNLARWLGLGCRMRFTCRRRAPR